MKKQMVEEYLRDLKLIIVINGSDSFIPPVVCVQICLHTKQSTGGAGSYYPKCDERSQPWKRTVHERIELN